MDVLTDDHEREEVVRKWWHENWLSLTVGVVIAIGAMVGYRQYQSYQNDTSAKYAYEMSTLQTKLVLNPANTTADAQKFIKEHEDIYGSLLALDLSSIEAKQGNYDKALENALFAKKNGAPSSSSDYQVHSRYHLRKWCDVAHHRPETVWSGWHCSNG